MPYLSRHLARFLAAVASAVLFLCAACGPITEEEQEYQRSVPHGKDGDIGTKNTDPTTGAIDPSAVGEGTEIVWKLWPCDEADAKPGLGDEELVITDKGTHDFILDDNDSFPLSLQGQFCTPQEFGRAIVFVVDVSESMRNQFNQGSDPIYGSGTCRRLDAINAVVDSFIEDDLVEFALVTFDAGVKRHSGGFFPADKFKTDWVNASVVCEIGTSTNYKAGLDKAEELFNNYAQDASKEVYFISDGLPNSQAEWGTTTADRIKATGMIATLMLGSNDAVLKNYIASKTSTGDPLHVTISTATSMAQQLLSLTESELSGGKVTYAALDNPALGVRVAIDPGDNESFKIYGIDSSRVNFPGGMKVTYSFWDTRSALFERTGVIKWIYP